VAGLGNGVGFALILRPGDIDQYIFYLVFI